MTSVYVESSSLLAWLFGEPSASQVIAVMDSAESIATSVLSLVEVQRALHRAEYQRILTPAQAERLRGMLGRSKSGWILMEISEEVRSRAARAFPVEPVRTLDAVHLATALLFIRVFPDLKLLSFDERILKNARSLGIEICT